MSKSPKISDRLADDAVTHALDLLRYSETEREQILVLFDDLAKDVRQQITEADLAFVQPGQFARQEQLIVQLRKSLEAFYGKINALSGSFLFTLAANEASFAITSLNAALGSDLLYPGLTPKELEVLASDILIQGAPSAEWWAKQSFDAQNRFAQQIRLGVSQGETNDQIIQRIIGRRTGQRQWVTDSNGNGRFIDIRTPAVLDVSRRDATALVRTSVQTVSNEVLLQTYRDNSDVIKGLQWIATLDPRTCLQCAARDLMTWDLDGNPIAPNKFVFVRPPLHFNCRCVLIPLLKSWNELIQDAGGTPLAGLDQVSESTRASMDGQVASSLSYNDWLKTKSDAFVMDVLGAARTRLFRSNKLTLAQMVDPSGNKISLNKLYRKSK